MLREFAQEIPYTNLAWLVRQPSFCPPRPAFNTLVLKCFYAGMGWILSNPCGAGWGFKKLREPTLPRKKKS
jgi:hypothetical protein